jgi:exopolysaccharide production protein ExoQ
MPPIVAFILCMILVAVLLCIERKRNQDASFALWVPTIWMLLNGSKPIARWLQPDAILASSQTWEEGSPIDRLVLSILIVLALFIIKRRSLDWSNIIRDNRWLIIFYLYLGFSILWSDFPYISMKRWVRLIGTIPIALLVMSERSPLQSLESVFRRCAYVLVPFSLLLIKYFPNFGIEYVSWSGAKMWVGVASQKNGLGTICGLSAFLIIWTFNREWRAGTLFKIKSQAFADGLVLFVALYLLRGYSGAYSATAIGITIAGIASLLFLYRMKNYTRHMANCIVIIVALGLLSLSISDSFVSFATSVFERNESFTGRTDIWRAVRNVASRNPLLGVGYGGYWGLQDKEIFSAVWVREAHSGYLEVYLAAGMVGITLLFAFLLAHYLKTIRKLNDAFDWGMFGICFLIMTLLRNFTESSFIMPSNYFWNHLIFLTVVFSSRYEHTNDGAMNIKEDEWTS